MTKEEYQAKYNTLMKNLSNAKLSSLSEVEKKDTSGFRILLGNAREAGYDTKNKAIRNILRSIYISSQYSNARKKYHHMYGIYKIFGRVKKANTARSAAGIYELLNWYKIADESHCLREDIGSYKEFTEVFKYLNDAKALKEYEEGKDNDDKVEQKNDEKAVNINAVDEEEEKVVNINAVDEEEEKNVEEENVKEEKNVNEENKINLEDDKSVSDDDGSEDGDDADDIQKQKKNFLKASARLVQARENLLDELKYERDYLIKWGQKDSKKFTKLKEDFEKAYGDTEDAEDTEEYNNLKQAREDAFLVNDGTKLYTNMTGALVNCINMLEKEDKYSQGEIEKELDKLSKAVSAYHKARNTSSGSRVSEYGTARLNVAKRLNEALNYLVMENKYAGRYMEASLNEQGIKTKDVNKIEDMEEVAELYQYYNLNGELTTAGYNEYVKKYTEDLEMNEESVSELKGDEAFYDELSKARDTYETVLIENISGAKELCDLYSVNRPIDYYLGILNKSGKATMQQKATWFVVKKHLDKIHNDKLNAKEAKKIWESLAKENLKTEVKKLKNEIKKLKSQKTFTDVMNAYGNKALDKWEKIDKQAENLKNEMNRLERRAYDVIDDNEETLSAEDMSEEQLNASTKFLIDRMSEAIAMKMMRDNETIYEICTYDEPTDSIHDNQRIKKFEKIVKKLLREKSSEGWKLSYLPSVARLGDYEDFERIYIDEGFKDIETAAVKEYKKQYGKSKSELNLVHNEILPDNELLNTAMNKQQMIQIGALSKNTEKKNLFDV